MDVRILVKFWAFFHFLLLLWNQNQRGNQNKCALEKFVFSELCEADDAREGMMSTEYPHKASANYFFWWFGSSTSGMYIVERGLFNFCNLWKMFCIKYMCTLMFKRPAIVHHDTTVVNVSVSSWTLSFAAPSSTWPWCWSTMSNGRWMHCPSCSSCWRCDNSCLWCSATPGSATVTAVSPPLHTHTHISCATVIAVSHAHTHTHTHISLSLIHIWRCRRWP